MSKPKTYVSTYCNFAHRMSTGRPIGHECIVIPPAALEAEREGDFDKAIAILQRSSRRPVGGRARSVGGTAAKAPPYLRASNGTRLRVGDRVRFPGQGLAPEDHVYGVITSIRAHKSEGWGKRTPKSNHVATIRDDDGHVWTRYGQDMTLASEARWSGRRTGRARARSVGGEGEPDYYRVVRFYFSHPSGASRRVLKPRVTLAVAQAHTHNNPESSSSTAKSAAARRLTKRVGAWFDGYEGVYVKRRGSRRRVGSTSSRRSLVSATHTKAAEAKVRSAAFARFGRKRKDVFFEHGQWFVRLDPLGASIDYSVVDTSRGLDFERL